jgi:hypothetical protein
MDMEQEEEDEDKRKEGIHREEYRAVGMRREATEEGIQQMGSRVEEGRLDDDEAAVDMQTAGAEGRIQSGAAGNSMHYQDERRALCLSHRNCCSRPFPSNQFTEKTNGFFGRQRN